MYNYEPTADSEYGAGGRGDSENPPPYGFEFSEKSIRHAFIRKVYAILTAQLLLTIAIIAVFVFVEPVKEYLQGNVWVFWVAFAATIILLICLACCGELRRLVPWNLIFLALFTACEGVVLGIASSSYNDQDAVIIAVGVTAVVVFALTIFAFQTKIDFTMCGGILFVLLIVLILFGFLCLIFQSKYAILAYACLGALLFSFYLVFDTQMMIGGTHRYSLSPEEYIFAALNLYLDIVNLFLYLLTIIGIARH